MTTEADVRPTPPRRIVVSAVLVALCVAATACGSSADGPVAVVDEAEPAVESTGAESSASGRTAVVDEADPAAESTGSDDLEYGDSLEDLTHASAEASRPAATALPGYRTVEWEDLIPPGFSGEQIFSRYEDRLDAAEPGSPEIDALYEEMNAEYDEASVNPQLDSEDIQLAGFVAPLTFDGDAITEFLLVPYFGACIHVPPPPANQTVMITLDEGESLTLDESWGAVWVAGKMRATTTNTDLATAGYSISGAQFGVYEPTESDGGAATADDVDSNREDDAAADVVDIPVPLPPEADGATASTAGTFTVVEFTVPLDQRDATIEFYDAWTDAQPDEYQRMEADNGAVSWQNAPEPGAVAIIIAVLAPFDGDDFVSVGVSTGGAE